MPTSSPDQAVILAPMGRDAEIACAILTEGGMPAVAVPTLATLVDTMRQGAGFALVTEEAVQDADLTAIDEFIRDQEHWSDFPFILLTRRGGGVERNPQATRLIDILGNVTFLERPFHPTTLLSVSRAARRARKRQYEARVALATIRHGEETLRVAMTAGKLGAWSLDTDGLILETSDECKAQYGRAPGESFDYRALLDSIHPDDQAYVRAQMREALQGGGDYDVEYRCLWPDGSTHWVQVRGSADRRRASRAIRMSGVSLDITDRKQIEAAITRSEGRFRAAIDAVRGVIWTNSADGRMIGEQPGWAALTGQSQDEYQDFGWAAAVHPDDAQATIDAWQQALAEARIFIFEHRVRRADGSWGIFDIRAVPTLDADGSIREWVGVHTDITEQRAAERALAELATTLEQRVATATADLRSSQMRMRSIFETSHQFFGELSPDGRLLDANATSLAAIDATLGDVVGRFFWETPWFTRTPGMPDLIQSLIGQVVEGGEVREELVIDLEGGLRTLDFSMRAVRDATGAIITLIPEALDITDRRRAEERLLQSQKLETIGQLTGGVAHDFNNLLTPIAGSLDLLRRKLEGDDRAQRMAAAGLQSAERARTLVNRLLAFARRQSLDTLPVDVAKLVEGMRDMIVRSIGPTIRVEVVRDGEVPPALVDPHQLELSILNLCVNARDAMPDGGDMVISSRLQTLTAAHGLELPPGDYVCVTVTDTGVGMDAETARRAIEPFYTTKGIGKGTGLGLSMVHGLVAQLGGAMQIESEVGHGTSISLWLPVVDEAAIPAPAPVAPPTAPSPDRSATVLLVDDEELVRFASADMLREAGYAVIEAASGPEARELVRAGLRPDMLVTDQLMPGQKGTELAAELCDMLPRLRVLVATGYADLPDIGLPRIGKPYSAAELVERVRSLVER